MAKKGKRTKLGELPRSGPEVAQASMVISALMMSPDEGLDKFRARRAANRSLDLAHLGRARDMLDAIAEAVTAADDQKERWQRVELAWHALFDTEPTAIAAPPLAAPLPQAPPLVVEPPALAAPAPPPPVPAVVPPAAALPLPPAMVPTPAPVQPPPVAPAAVPAGLSGLPAHALAALAAMEQAQVQAGADDLLPLNQTLPIGDAAIRAPVLPFVGGAFVPAPASTGAVPPGPRRTLGVNAVNAVPEPAPAKAPAHKPPTLPFARPPAASDQAPAGPGTADLRAKADPAGRASPTAVERMMGATTEVDSGDHPSRQPLAQALRLATAQAAARSGGAPAAGAVGPTGAARPSSPPPAALPSGTRPSTPPPPPQPAELPPEPLPPHLAHLSVEQFATYCAHCAASPDNLGAIDLRYGITSPAERSALERHWHGRLSQDPALLAAWRQHLARAKSFVGNH